MATIFLFTFVSALLASLLMVFTHPPRTLPAAASAGALTFLLLLLIRFTTFPVFTHWLDWAYMTYAYLTLLIGWGAASAWAIDEDENNAFKYGWIPMLLVLTVQVVSTTFFVPPTMCGPVGHQRLAALLNERQGEALHFQEIDPSKKVQVSEQMALERARVKVDGDIGSYLEVSDVASLQLIQGHPYYVVGLRVKSGQWNAFTSKGSVIPGYIIVDALDKDAQAQFKGGYQMKVVDADRIGFSFELDTVAYYNYFAKHSYTFADLASLEVDDEGKPFYSATLLENVVGNTGKQVVGTMVLDPQTAEITEYFGEEMPTWLNDIWTREIFEQYATFWGQYKVGKVCQWADQSGKKQVDSITDVFASDGQLWYQVTMTSMGSDTAISDVLYGNPKTGEVVHYDVSGQGFTIIEKVKELFIDAGQIESPLNGVDAVEIELDYINGEWVYYGILLAKDEAGNTTGTFKGFALMRAADAAAQETEDVVIDGDIYSAVRQLRQKSGQADRKFSATDSQEQFSGSVQRVYPLDDGSNVVIRMILEGEPLKASQSLSSTTALTIAQSTQALLIPIEASALENDGVASHVIVGDRVIVTVRRGEHDKWYALENMIIVGDPVFGGE